MTALIISGLLTLLVYRIGKTFARYIEDNKEDDSDLNN